MLVNHPVQQNHRLLPLPHDPDDILFSDGFQGSMIERLDLLPCPRPLQGIILPVQGFENRLDRFHLPDCTGFDRPDQAVYLCPRRQQSGQIAPVGRPYLRIRPQTIPDLLLRPAGAIRQAGNNGVSQELMNGQLIKLQALLQRGAFNLATLVGISIRSLPASLLQFL